MTTRKLWSALPAGIVAICVVPSLTWLLGLVLMAVAAVVAVATFGR